MIQVNIIRGEYRGRQISGTYALIDGYKVGARGGFITIHNPNPIPGTPSHQRIKVSPGDYTLIDGEGQPVAETSITNSVRTTAGTNAVVPAAMNYEAEFTSSETEDEAMERIAATFAMLDRIVDSAAKGVVRGLVVSGPPGIGKSFGVEKQLDVANIFRKMTGEDPKYEIITGGVSAVGLFQKLYYNRQPENVLVFDDCDAVLFDEECLSLLKGALNSGDKRRIAWNKESRILADLGIPSHFDFEGSVIFLSNIDFERTIARGSRIASHLEAIMSRCHYLDLEIGSTRDKILRIKQIVRDGMLTPYDFSNNEEQMIVDFVVENAEHLRELSLRMVKKIADFVKTDPASWHEMAEATCLSKEAKFKRLLAKKQQEAERRGAVLAESE